MFTIADYPSPEQYDLAKFIEFKGDCFDYINSPFLTLVAQLPTVDYYNVNDGHKNIDEISQDAYDTPFLAYLIQYYNGTTKEYFEEDTVLNLFSLSDLNNTITNLNVGKIDYNLQ